MDQPPTPETLGLFNTGLLDSGLHLSDWFRRHPRWVAGVAACALIKQHLPAWGRACDLAGIPDDLEQVPAEAVAFLLKWAVGSTADLTPFTQLGAHARGAAAGLQGELFSQRRMRDPELGAALGGAHAILSAVATALEIEAVSADRAVLMAEQLFRAHGCLSSGAAATGTPVRPEGAADLLRPLLDRICRLPPNRRLLLRIAHKLQPQPTVDSVVTWVERSGDAGLAACEIARRHRYADACWDQIRETFAIGEV